MPGHLILPDSTTGYELNEGRGLLSVIVPRAAVNLVPNPDIERGRLAGWRTSQMGQMDPVNPHRGAYSLCVAASASVTLYAQTGNDYLVQTMPTVAGKTYVVSFAYRTNLATAGVNLQVRLNGAVSGNTIGGTLGYRIDGKAASAIPQSGVWRRVTYVWTEIASQNRMLIIETTAATTGRFWIDDVQMELGLEPSTPISGGVLGVGVESGDYAWYGTPWDSPSYRSAAAVSGGDVVNLADFGLRVLAVSGLGLGGYRNVIQASSTGGGHYSETIVEGTPFTVVGKFQETNLLRLQQRRDALIQALRHDRAGKGSRPVFLRFQLVRCSDVLADPIDIQCVYQGGLEGALDNLYAEGVAIEFLVYGRNLIAERQRAQALYNVQAAQTTVMALHDLTTDTIAHAAITNVTNIRAARPMPDGDFMLAGPFTNAGSVATANAVCKWDPTTGAVTGYGAATISGVGVDGFVVSRRGSVFAFGEFTQIGGQACSNFAELKETDGAWWNFPFTALNARCRGVVEVGTLLYAYGDFTDRLRVHDYAGIVPTGAVTLAQTSTSVLSAVYDDRTNRLYYSAVNGATSAHIGYIDVATQTATLIQSHAGSAISYPGVFVMRDGTVCFVRSSTTAGTRSGICKLTATLTLQALAEYPSGYTGGVSRTWQDATGTLHLATTTTTQLGGIYSPAQHHWWDGSRVHASRLHLGRAAYSTLGFYEEAGPYRLWTFEASTFVGIPAANTIEDVGDTAPVALTFQGPGLLNAIENVTTGDEIEFNAIVLMGETVTVDTRTGKITSSLSVSKTVPVLTQSTVARWKLAPGDNRIRVRFWPRLGNAAGSDYTAVLSGTANNPGTAFLFNASLGNTENGKIRWSVDASDNGVLSIIINGSQVVTTGTLPATQTIVPGTTAPVPLTGSLDLVPMPGPATGQIYYPLTHITFDDRVASVDQAASR